MRGKVKDWFSSFIHNRQQFTSIYGPNSELNKIFHGVPQSSALGLLLLIIYITDLHYAAIYDKVRHFADDTNLFFGNKSINKINTVINHDWPLLIIG